MSHRLRLHCDESSPLDCPFVINSNSSVDQQIYWPLHHPEICYDRLTAVILILLQICPKHQLLLQLLAMVASMTPSTREWTKSCEHRSRRSHLLLRPLRFSKLTTRSHDLCRAWIQVLLNNFSVYHICNSYFLVRKHRLRFNDTLLSYEQIPSRAERYLVFTFHSIFLTFFSF